MARSFGNTKSARPSAVRPQWRKAKWSLAVTMVISTVLGTQRNENRRINQGSDAGKANHRRQLFRLQLPPVFVLETGVLRSVSCRARPPTKDQHSTGHLRPHSLLPQTLSFLL